jgi:hypothetical protein
MFGSDSEVSRVHSMGLEFVPHLWTMYRLFMLCYMKGVGDLGGPMHNPNKQTNYKVNFNDNNGQYLQCVPFGTFLLT